MMLKRVKTAALAVLAAATTQATDFSGIYLGSYPKVNADGSAFVFEWNDSIWLASTAGGMARRLTPEETAEANPVLSPDGRRVVFISNRDGAFKVFELDMENSCPRQWTRHSESTVPYGWSADGVSLVATVVRDDDSSERASRAAVILPSGVEYQIAPGVEAYEPAMSPDGRYLAFTYRKDDMYRKRRSGTSSKNREIWLRDLSDGSYAKLPVAAESASCAVWRPDGKAVYYLGRAAGESVASVREYVLETGADRRVVSFGDDAAFQPSVSADGRTMLVRSGFDFWRFDPTAETPQPVAIQLYPETFPSRLSGTYRRFYEKAWNGNGPGDVTFASGGREIAFTCGGGLYAMDSTMRTPRLVAEAKAAWISECFFSPDASRLYYLVNLGDGSEIWYAMRGNSSLPWWENTSFEHTMVVKDESVRYGLTVSPDGTRVAWTDSLGVFVFAMLDGTVISRGPEATGAGEYAWSPDSRSIVAELSDGDGNSDLWILSVDGTREPFNLTRGSRWDGTPAWSPDGRIIAWSSEHPGHDRRELSYVYLDPEIEMLERDSALEKSRREISSTAPDDGAKPRTVDCTIVFEGLHDRIRRTGLYGMSPFFSHDARTLAYNAGSRTDYISIPGDMKPRKLSSLTGRAVEWYAKDDRLAWVVDCRPAHLDDVIGFKVYREDDLADFRELVFRTAWGRLRDVFYDRTFRGIDWKAVEERYAPAARNASSYSVFTRVMYMMFGEMDASHTGFYKAHETDKEWIRTPVIHRWTKITCHLGLVFEPGSFRVAHVIEGSPAQGIVKKGETVLAVDGTPLVPGETVLSDLLESTEGSTFQLSVEGRGGKPVYVKGVSYAKMRELVAAEKSRERRRRVHEASGGKIGYIEVRQMDMDNYHKFEEEVFSEGWGRDSLIIDLRGNLGGYTADRLLSIVCGADHSYDKSPNGLKGYLFSYWTRPVFSKPICVIVDERTQSNGEIFSHAIKTLGRGKIAGRKSAGEVIATYERKIFDYGYIREPFWGWYKPDGTDMENNGVVPDVPVDLTPSDAALGVDPQLDAAISTLAGETA